MSAVTVAASFCNYARALRHTLHRYYGAGDLHFITCSCYRRRPLLGTTRRRDLFLRVLERVRKRYVLVVVVYVVMPEHIHLLLSEPQEKNLSVVMQALKLALLEKREKGRTLSSWVSTIQDGPRYTFPQMGPTRPGTVFR